MAALLICGPAPSVHADQAAANRPAAEVMAVNGAAAVVRADYLFTLHPETAHCWRRAQARLRRTAGLDPAGFSVVSAPPERGPVTAAAFGVDIWRDVSQRMATSGWAAVQAGVALGFDEIILCGVPLNGGDGAAPGAVTSIGEYPANGPTMARIRLYLRAYADDLRRRRADVRVHSMSGHTRKVLGPPQNVLVSPENNSASGGHGGQRT